MLCSVLREEPLCCALLIMKNQCVVQSSSWRTSVLCIVHYEKLPFCADVAHNEEPLCCAVLIVKNQCVVQNLLIMKIEPECCAELMMKKQCVVQSS